MVALVRRNALDCTSRHTFHITILGCMARVHTPSPFEEDPLETSLTYGHIGLANTYS
jgi:hypothetical protein